MYSFKYSHTTSFCLNRINRLSTAPVYRGARSELILRKTSELRGSAADNMNSIASCSRQWHSYSAVQCKKPVTVFFMFLRKKCIFLFDMQLLPLYVVNSHKKGIYNFYVFATFKAFISNMLSVNINHLSIWLP